MVKKSGKGSDCRNQCPRRRGHATWSLLPRLGSVGAGVAGLAALRLHVGQVAAAQPAESLAEANRQPIPEANRPCVGERERGGGVT